MQRNAQNASRTIKRLGTFRRKSDAQCLARFWCFECKKSFSAATISPLRWQKKRQYNFRIRRMLNGTMSQREIARSLGLNRKTVVRTFRRLGLLAQAELRAWNLSQRPACEVEFDDLETFEHTKCKPLSVTLMVEFKTRRILGFEISQMPAKGHLAAIARKKYGVRIDHRQQGRARLLSQMQELVKSEAVIRSDSNPHYIADVKRFFPSAKHECVLGGRGAITGQGELKKQLWDPIFSLNHTCAMLRANINRLIRKTWCTTKKPDQLGLHIALYALQHNQRLGTG